MIGSMLFSGCIGIFDRADPTDFELNARRAPPEAFVENTVDNISDLKEYWQPKLEEAAVEGESTGKWKIINKKYIIVDNKYYSITSTKIGENEYRYEGRMLADNKNNFIAFAKSNLVLYRCGSGELSNEANERIKTAINTGTYENSPADKTDKEIFRYIEENKKSYIFWIECEGGYYDLLHTLRTH